MTFLETILREIQLILNQYGIEAISEEEIMNKLDIRPSTFRELFASKADMVKQVALFDIEVQKKEQAALLARAENPVEEIMLLLTNGINKLQEINPLLLQEMQELYPDIWAIHLDYLSNYSQHLNSEIINRGILSGYFRKDVNIQLVTKIILEQFYMMINPAVFPPERYNLAEVFRSIYLYYMRGLCTESGGKLAEAYFSKSNM